jgi:hypothetical protein
MTKREARDLLENSRDDYGGKDPSNAMLMLRRVFERALPAERAVLNDVIREWLLSENEADRFDGVFLTGEFRIVQNLDLIKKLRAEAERRNDPPAPYENAKYDRVEARLQEATWPNFPALDPVLNEWTSQHGLQVLTGCRDEDIRSVAIVDAAGREFQIWLQVDSRIVTVNAASKDRRRRFWRSWAAEPPTPDALSPLLDSALLEVRRRSATLDGETFDEAGLT